MQFRRGLTALRRCAIAIRGYDDADIQADEVFSTIGRGAAVAEMKERNHCSRQAKMILPLHHVAQYDALYAGPANLTGGLFLLHISSRSGGVAHNAPVQLPTFRGFAALPPCCSELFWRAAFYT